MPKRVRLIDIAQRLDLTKVSVSKALRDHPDISRETRALVKKTAAEMGYSPNLVARSLISRRSHTLGVVVPKIAHTFFASLIEAVQAEATVRGYGIVLAVSNERAALERQHIERLLAMRVDGLLVSVSQEAPDLEIFEQVRQMRVPLVFFDRRVAGLPFSSVTVDDRGGARRAVAHLIAQGYRHIAHVGGSPLTEIGRARRAGYEEALATHGLPIFEPWIVEGGFDERHGYEAGRQILASGRLPDVIFAVTYPASLGVHAALAEQEPSLVGRVQIASFGAGGINERYTHPHYSVRQPTDEMGRCALRLLLQAVEAPDEAPELPPQHVVLDTEILPPPAALGRDGSQGETGETAA